MSLNNLANRLSALGRREEAADLYRALAAQRPDAFTPNLVTSLGTLGSILRQEATTMGTAATLFAEGIERLKPLFIGLPPAYAPLMQSLTQAYLGACQKAEIEPDMALLGPVDEMLQRLNEAAEAGKVD